VVIVLKLVLIYSMAKTGV